LGLVETIDSLIKNNNGLKYSSATDFITKVVSERVEELGKRKGKS